MFWAIVLTLVISSLTFTILALRDFSCRKVEECRELRSSNEKLNRKLQDCHDFELRRVCRENYRHGLYDGRETDALYRSMVKKYESSKRATVIMYGEPDQQPNTERQARGGRKH